MCLVPLPVPAPAPSPTPHQAFGVAKFGRVQRVIQRNLDRGHRKDHLEIKRREAEVAPPVVVAVVGPKGCGKSSLIRVRVLYSV